jgi:DNA polymerase-3 subunit gamma/tau
VANLALYRKYRPRTFDEVIGQEHVTGPLIQALKNDKLTHAYLFSGPRGCGKTSSARILARSLNCSEGPTPNPCGACDSCVALAPNGGGSLDVIEIDAASHNGVDDARDLREKAFFAPVSSRYKVYVIDEAHMVTTAAFNALLKLVEEPPDFVKFIFATTEPEKVLQTIRSRTHHYPFRLVPPKELRDHLQRLCEEEGVAVEPTVFPLVVRAGGGSVRDSLSVLDQLLAGAGPEGVQYARAVTLLGVTDMALLDEMCDGLAAADGAAVFATVDRVVEAGHDPRRFATDLLERLRDLVVLDRVPDAAAKGLIDAPADQLERMTGQALRLGPASLSRMADTVHDGLVQMRGTTSARLVLELVCARMLLPAADDSQSALLQRLERLERRFEIGGAPVGAVPAVSPAAASTPSAAPPIAPAPAVAAPPVAPPTAPAAPAPAPAPAAAPTAPAPAATPVPEPVAPAVSPPRPVPAAAAPAPAAAPGALDAAAVRRVWPSILDAVKKRKRTTHVLLTEATVVSVDGSTLVLTHANAPLVRRLSEDQNVTVLREALREVLGVDWQLRYEGGAQPAARGAQSRGVSAASSAGAPSAAPVKSTVADDGWPAVRAVPTGGQGSAPAEQAAPAQAPPEQALPAQAAQRAPAEQARAVPPTQVPSGQRAPSPRVPAADLPPLEEPPPDDEPDYETYDAYNSSEVVSAGPPPVSPEAAAFALLEEQLGARRIDET